MTNSSKSVKNSMYTIPILWSSKCHVREMSTMGSSAHVTQMGPRLLPKDAAFSMECLAREALGSGTRRSPMESQLHQEKVSFSARMEPQWQPKEAAFSIGSNKDKGISNGIHEECKEFGRMFREKLQEFAMILIKKYQYNFPVEYFDDYHGSFNKEEFLGMEQQEEKLKEKANKEARSIDHFMEELERESEVKERRNQKPNCYEDGLLVAEMSSNVVKVCRVDPKMCHNVAVNFEVEEQQQWKAEGLDNVEGFLSNDKRETTPAEGRLADPKQCHHIAANFGDDKKRGTYVVAGQLEFRNDRHLKAVGLQISAATCDKERLNSLKAFDVNTLTAEEYPRIKKKWPIKGMIKERTTKLERVGIG